MSLIVVKRFLYGKIPSLTDPKIIYLISIHSITFLFFHSEVGNSVMEYLRRSHRRKFFQETFKGYAKGLKMLMLVNKGITRVISDEFFIWLLVVRCVASSLFKSCILSLFTKKRIKYAKPKANLLFNAIPSITLFII